MNTQFIRDIIYKMILVLNTVVPIKEHAVIVLCYHSIAKDSWRFSVPMSELEMQVTYLLKTRQPLSIPDFEKYLSGKLELTKPSFIITFDDGYQDILQSIAFFKSKDIKPAVFVLAEPENANTAELETEKQFLNNAEIKKLHVNGWTIGSHSATHADFGSLNNSMAEYEVIESKRLLETALKLPIKHFAYPKGRYSKRIGECVKIARYNIAFTMDDGRISTACDTRFIPRIGVDGSHGFTEFKSAITPLAIFCRSLVKKYWSNK